MDTQTFRILQILAEQVKMLAETIRNHPEYLTECEVYTLEGIADTLKDVFELDD